MTNCSSNWLGEQADEEAPHRHDQIGRFARPRPSSGSGLIVAAPAGRSREAAEELQPLPRGPTH